MCKYVNSINLLSEMTLDHPEKMLEKVVIPIPAGREKTPHPQAAC